MHIIRWQGSYPPQEQDLRKRIQLEGLPFYTWSNAPGDTYSDHTHRFCIVCAARSAFISPIQSTHLAQSRSLI